MQPKGRKLPKGQTKLHFVRLEADKTAPVASRLPSASGQVFQNALESLKRVFGHTHLKPHQETSLRAYIASRDVLLVQPTGSGKSLCYQLPGLAHDNGLVLVISPLIALMQNQISALKQKNIAAELLCSSIRAADRSRIIADINSASPKTRLLYLSPEALVGTRSGAVHSSCTAIRKAVTGLARRQKLLLVAVDEAHCVSEWGHDFRPAFRQLNFITSAPEFTRVPVMALTATAAPNVKTDIIDSLGLRSPLIIDGTLDRPNLTYEVRHTCHLEQSHPGSVYGDLVATLEENLEHGGSALVYCLSKSDCEELSARLVSDGVTAGCYHAGMPNQQREKVLDGWMMGRLECVVATTAFGMGVDKKDVRLVVHWSLAKGIEQFVQESGRAGRDHKPALSVMYYSHADLKRLQFLLSSRVEPRRAELDSLEAISAYATGLKCRRQSILTYFGQTTSDRSQQPMQCCDVCSLGAQEIQRRMSISICDANNIEEAQSSPLKPENNSSMIGSTLGFCRPRVQGKRPRELMCIDPNGGGFALASGRPITSSSVHQGFKKPRQHAAMLRDR